MFGFGTNQLLNILILLLPFAILIFVIRMRRGQQILIKSNKCAKAWNRIVAFVIDVTLCLAVLFAMDFFFKKIGFDILQKHGEIAFFLLSWLYFSFFESSKLQATLGKYFSGIIVTDLNGGRLSFFRATIRYLSTFISDMSFFIGHLMIPFNKHKQGLHDMITNTLVLSK